MFVRAPARINLLGEHIDYNDGIVLPTAINKEFLFALAPSGSSHFTFIAKDLNESTSFEINELTKGKGWVSYLMGVIHSLQQIRPISHGVNCIFASNIPIGAGLSSSAALCSGFGYGLNEIFDLGLLKLDLVHIAQKAEHTFADVACGIMDPYASLFSVKEYILSLDCRENCHDLVPFNYDNIEILLIDTCVKHNLAATAYNKRREACDVGITILKKEIDSVGSFRDVSMIQLNEVRNKLDADVFEKCTFVIEEMMRVDEGIRFLKEKNLIGFGSLMYKAHQGLSEKYDVSCPELDYLVELASENQLIGARMMGGGFGGCTINLMDKQQRSAFELTAKDKYQSRFGITPLFYSVSPCDGTSHFTWK